MKPTILITGSRDWYQPDFFKSAVTQIVVSALGFGVDQFDRLHVLVGDCPRGVDWWVRNTGRNHFKWTVKVFEANWNQHGLSAGPKRNRKMVMEHPDICIGFIRNRSRGATNCVNLATSAGIDTYVIRFDEPKFAGKPIETVPVRKSRPVKVAR